MLNGNKKIFVADDDADILQIISIMLKTQGYEVDISKNANEIFNYQKYNLPDLILLDIWMSGLDGREICYELKKNILTKDIPVLFVSANANIREIAIEYKANGFIAKPFDMSYLLSKINNSFSTQQ